MTTSHTPGIWNVSTDYIPAAQLHVYILRNEPKGMDEIKANARLIKAAPELLDECREQLLCWKAMRDGKWNGSPEGFETAIKQLQAVIAKAVL